MGHNDCILCLIVNFFRLVRPKHRNKNSKPLYFQFYFINLPQANKKMQNPADPRRPQKVARYKPLPAGSPSDDPTPDYMNLLGMIFSMCGLMMKLKWCAWVAVYCSFISFANSRTSDDTKQMLSSFMLSISAVVMSYLQNPQPMQPPW